MSNVLDTEDGEISSSNTADYSSDGSSYRNLRLSHKHHNKKLKQSPAESLSSSNLTTTTSQNNKHIHDDLTEMSTPSNSSINSESKVCKKKQKLDDSVTESINPKQRIPYTQNYNNLGRSGDYPSKGYTSNLPDSASATHHKADKTKEPNKSTSSSKKESLASAVTPSSESKRDSDFAHSERYKKDPLDNADKSLQNISCSNSNKRENRSINAMETGRARVESVKPQEQEDRDKERRQRSRSRRDERGRRSRRESRERYDSKSRYANRDKKDSYNRNCRDDSYESRDRYERRDRHENRDRYESRDRRDRIDERDERDKRRNADTSYNISKQSSSSGLKELHRNNSTEKPKPNSTDIAPQKFTDDSLDKNHRISKFNIKSTDSLDSNINNLDPKYDINTGHHSFYSKGSIASSSGSAKDSTRLSKLRNMNSDNKDILDFSEFDNVDNEELEIQKRREKRLAILKKYKSTEPKSENGTDIQAKVEAKRISASSIPTTDEIIVEQQKKVADISTTPPKELLNGFNAYNKQRETPLSSQINTSDFDMFASGEDLEAHKSVKSSQLNELQTQEPNTSSIKLRVSSTGNETRGQLDTQATGLEGNWDDDEGYYRIVIGERLLNRYLVTSVLGQGVFSTVVSAVDTFKLENKNESESQSNTEVAIKIIRNNDTMYKLAKHEIQILLKLSNRNSKSTPKYIIEYIDSFEYKNHLCLIFEKLEMNLRQTLKLFGLNVGLHMEAVTLYAHQLFCSLLILEKRKIVHSDFKPDNILVSKNKKHVKLADFGSATFINSNEDTSEYLVSRFYRPPEVILGCNSKEAVDMWSLGCTLYELFTGRVLFPGRSNNQMLKLIMELKGRFPNRMLRKAKYANDHFVTSFRTGGTEPALNAEVSRNSLLFLSHEVVREKPHINFSGNDNLNDLASNSIDFHQNQVVVKKINFNVTSSINNFKRLLNSTVRMTNLKEHMKINHFADLLDKCLELVPEKRITPSQAMAHPFFTTQ